MTGDNGDNKGGEAVCLTLFSCLRLSECIEKLVRFAPDNGNQVKPYQFVRRSPVLFVPYQDLSSIV